MRGKRSKGSIERAERTRGVVAAWLAIVAGVKLDLEEEKAMKLQGVKLAPGWRESRNAPLYFLLDFLRASNPAILEFATRHDKPLSAGVIYFFLRRARKISPIAARVEDSKTG